MRVFEIIVPLTRNDGNGHGVAAWDKWENGLSRLYNGFTRMGGNATGEWVHEGKTYRDMSRVYRVMGDDTGADLVPLFFACFPDQKAVAIFGIGEGSIISNPAG